MTSPPDGATHVIVVGAGVIGLLTAVRCVQLGARVTVLDQAAIPNSRATSHDRHRVLRALHPGDLPATSAAVSAHRDWLGLERLLGGGLYYRAGALTASDPGSCQAGLALLTQAGASARYLAPGDLAGRFGHIGFGPGVAAVQEFNAGVLLADKILAALAGWLSGRPAARLRPHVRATGVDPDGATVTSDDGTVIGGDRIVIAAGPWSRALLPDGVALTLYRQSMLYCRPPRASLAGWSATPACPALGTPDGAWLVPPVAGTPLKVSAAAACRAVSGLAGHDTPREWRDHLTGRFRELLPGFDESWVIGAKDCYYLAHGGTGGSLLVQLGGGLTWVYGACGGSSFKYAPLIARTLARRVIDGYFVERTGLTGLDQPLFMPSVPNVAGGTK